MSEQNRPGLWHFLDFADLFDLPVWCWVVVAAGAFLWLLLQKISGAEVVR